MVARPRVWLSKHALERATERGGVGAPAAIAVEVADAIADGRVACRKPRLLVPRGRRPRAHAASARFAWTEGLERVFVIRRARSSRGERGVLVLTVFTPLGDDDRLDELDDPWRAA